MRENMPGSEQRGKGREGDLINKLVLEETFARTEASEDIQEVRWKHMWKVVDRGLVIGAHIWDTATFPNGASPRLLGGRSLQEGFPFLSRVEKGGGLPNKGREGIPILLSKE